MHRTLIALSLLLCSMTSAIAQVGIRFSIPGLSIGINLPVYPDLVPVPGYPVYYAPRVNSNYFFYDGLYWVYHGDNWFASSWYNGPWGYVAPEAVPLFVLRIPVNYYRHPPPYFRGWRADAPPRWNERWGRQWEQRRGGWNSWKRDSIPAPAPLPLYQRSYTGTQYPREAQRQALERQNYRYQGRDSVARQYYRGQDGQDARPNPQRQSSDANRGRVQQPQHGRAQAEQRTRGRRADRDDRDQRN